MQARTCPPWYATLRYRYFNPIIIRVYCVVIRSNHLDFFLWVHLSSLPDKHVPVFISWDIYLSVSSFEDVFGAEPLGMHPRALPHASDSFFFNSSECTGRNSDPVFSLPFRILPPADTAERPLHSFVCRGELVLCVYTDIFAQPRQLPSLFDHVRLYSKIF